MRVLFSVALVILSATSCQQSPQAITSVVEITREVEVTRELDREVTRIVEVTRLIPEIVTVVVFPTEEPTLTAIPTDVPTLVPTSVTESQGFEFQKYDSTDAIAAFQNAGLEVGSIIPEVQEAGGLRPNTWVEGNRFLIPSLGDDRGGRVLSFASQNDLRIIEDYYKGFSGFLASWVSVKHNLVLQVGADLPREQWLQYEKVFQALP